MDNGFERISDTERELSLYAVPKFYGVLKIAEKLAKFSRS